MKEICLPATSTYGPFTTSKTLASSHQTSLRLFVSDHWAQTAMATKRRIGRSPFSWARAKNAPINYHWLSNKFAMESSGLLRSAAAYVRKDAGFWCKKIWLQPLWPESRMQAYHLRFGFRKSQIWASVASEDIQSTNRRCGFLQYRDSFWLVVVLFSNVRSRLANKSPFLE